MNYLETLQDIFPNHWETAIQQVINDVQAEIPTATDSEKIERMSTLLIENYANESLAITSDNSTNEDSDDDNVQILRGQLTRRFTDVCPVFLDEFLARETVRLDYAAITQHFQMNGYRKKNQTEIPNTSKNAELTEQMKQLFPDACEIFINKCINEGLDLDALIDKFTTESYIKTNSKEKSINGKLIDFHNRLCDMLPKFDPDFLLDEAKKLPQLTDLAFSNCVAGLLDMKEFPTIGDYKKRQGQKDRMLNYLFDFKIDMFLKEFSFNLKTFENNKRKHSLMAQNVIQTELENNKHFAFVMLCYVYSGIAPTLIDVKLKQCQYDIIQCCNSLGQPQRKDFFRTEINLPSNSYSNRLMFQELAYVMYHTLINNYLNVRTSSYERAYKEAEAAKQLRTCKTCFEDGLLLMPEEVYQCTNGCDFCKQCMIRGCEVAYGDGLLEIECFDNCGATFSDYILQMVMDPIAYVKLMQRKQIKAIREARLDGFETCPSCEWGTVMSKADKIFICRNPECGKEFCRECQHEAHIPLRCNEIEYDEDVKMRTFIENQMTAALIRVCKKCDRKIIKETGCNKMTCPCGQTMCYVCGESGITYNHFGTRCPQQSNQEVLHRNDILRGIEAAKVKLGVDKNPNKLKFDPSKGF